MMLRDRLVLIVEDEPIVALGLEDLIYDAGGHPVSAERLDEAFALIAEFRFELAILDINVHGHQSYPVAATLAGMSVPFLFATGYGDTLHPPEFESIPTIVKPYSLADIERALEALAT
jgi:DNA-binding response OmpR family regulator